MLTNVFVVLLFTVLTVFIFLALFAFFAGLVGLNNLVSELLSAVIIISLLFGAKMFFLKVLIAIFIVVIFSIIGYKIIIKAKRISWQDYEEKQKIGIYTERGLDKKITKHQKGEYYANGHYYHRRGNGCDIVVDN